MLVKCIICGSDLSNIDFFYAKDLMTSVQGKFCYKKCTKCQSYIQDPIPTQDFLNKCYKEQALTYKIPQKSKTQKLRSIKSIMENTLRPVYDALNMFVNKNLVNRINTINLIPSKKSGAKVLELGAAYGKYLNTLKQSGYEVTGVEPTLESCQKAKELHDIDLINKTIEEVHFEVESFDVIVMSMVLEHTLDPKFIITQCYKWLKKDGELLISIPTADGFEFKMFKEYCYVTQPPYHITLQTKKGFKLLIKGLFNIKNYIYQFSGDRDLCFSAYYKTKEKKSLIVKLLSVGYDKLYFQYLVKIFLIIGTIIFGLKTSRVSIRLKKVSD